MVTTAMRNGFQANGFAALGAMFTPDETHALKGEADYLLGLTGSTPGLPEDHLMRSVGATGHARVGLHLCHRSEIFRAQALKPSAVSLIGGLFGEEPAVLTSLLFHKAARVGESLTAHQDLPYYPYLRADDLITCWTALTEVSEANGCLHYFEASHRDYIPHQHTGAQQALDIDPGQLTGFKDSAVALRAGECCVHHGLTAHYSGANYSDRPRLGIAMLYVRASAHVSLDDFPYPLLRPGRA